MKIKMEKGIAGVDMVIAIVAVMIFSTLIFSLIYNNVMENAKLKKETLAMIYLTEILENVGIEEYNNINETNIKNSLSQEITDGYNVDVNVTNVSGGNIMKKIKVTLTYELVGKTYSYSMERMKVKE